MRTIRKTAGDYLREWRGKRRMSQLELASEAEISARHLSFLETGRSQASREMLLRLSEQLDIPLRERNVILLAAGYAPVFEERPLASPEMGRMFLQLNAVHVALNAEKDTTPVTTQHPTHRLLRAAA